MVYEFTFALKHNNEEQKKFELTKEPIVTYSRELKTLVYLIYTTDNKICEIPYEDCEIVEAHCYRKEVN